MSVHNAQQSVASSFNYKGTWALGTMAWWPAALIAMCVATLAGCGVTLPAHVVGTVRLNDERVVTGTVTFHPVNGGTKAVGKIASFGMYELMTGRQVGLMPGKYYVTVVGRTVLDDGSGGKVVPQLLVPKHYGDSSLSGIQVTVAAGENSIPLDLVRIAPPKEKEKPVAPEALSDVDPSIPRLDPETLEPIDPATEKASPASPDQGTKDAEELIKRFESQFPER